MRNKKVLFLTQAAVIAAIYVVLTIFISAFNLASGAIQVRIQKHSPFYHFLHRQRYRDLQSDVCSAICLQGQRFMMLCSEVSQPYSARLEPIYCGNINFYARFRQ